MRKIEIEGYFDLPKTWKKGDSIHDVSLFDTVEEIMHQMPKAEHDEFYVKGKVKVILEVEE